MTRMGVLLLLLGSTTAAASSSSSRILRFAFQRRIQVAQPRQVVTSLCCRITRRQSIPAPAAVGRRTLMTQTSSSTAIAASGSSNEGDNPTTTTSTPSSATTTTSLDHESRTKDFTCLRTLALHGSEGNAKSITQRLQQWNDAFQLQSSQQRMVDVDENDDRRPTIPHLLSLHAIDAPHRKSSSSSSDEDGYAWWIMPPGIRSFTATEYNGFDDSASAVLDAVVESSPDLIIGHSQGAILITALLALQQIIYHPKCGYILNGVAWPNPFTNELEQLSTKTTNALSHVRILILIGNCDTINPPAQGMRVAQALQKAGADVTVWHHPGGHAIPSTPETCNSIQSWLRESVSTQSTAKL